jgi:hypothetical protein
MGLTDSRKPVVVLLVVAGCSAGHGRPAQADAAHPAVSDRFGVVGGELWIAMGEGRSIRVRGDQVAGGRIDGCSRIVHASMAGVVCEGDGGLLVVDARGRRLRLASGFAPRDPILLASSDTAVAVFAPGSLALWRDGGWSVTPVTAPRFVRDNPAFEPEHGPDDPLGQRSHVIVLPPPGQLAIHAGQLFFGFGAGEYGGWIGTLDPSTGTWVIAESASRRPVERFYQPRAGALWVVGFLGHKGPAGDIHVHASAAITELLDTARWSLGPADLRGAFLSRGRRYVASGMLGLVRQHDGEWSPVLPSWKPAHLRDVAFHDDRAYLLLEGELVAVDIPSHHTTRLHLP